MSDLSTLFTRHVIPGKLESSSQPKPARKSTESKLSLSSHKGQEWNLSNLQSSLKKGIKKQVPLSSLSEEIQQFQAKQKQQYILKGFILGGIILIIQHLMNFGSKIALLLLSLIFLKLLPKLPFQILQQQILRVGARILTPFIYSSLLYYFLKNTKHAIISDFNPSVTVVTLFFTTLSVVTQYLEPIHRLNIQQLQFANIDQQGQVNKIFYSLTFFFKRFEFYSRIKKGLLLATYFNIVIQTSVLILLGISPLKVWTQYKSFTTGLFIFLLLQFFVQAFKYADNLFLQLKAVRNRMPVFMSLFRLQGNSLYRKAVQNKCLLNLVTTIAKTSCFLSSETCKSLIYDTYMDLFNQYAFTELQRTQAAFAQEFVAIISSQKALESKKTFLIDMFIYLRKLFAYLRIQHSAINHLHSLSQVITLIRVLILSDYQAYVQKSPIKVQTRMVDILQVIQAKLHKQAENERVMDFLRKQLLLVEKKLEGWVIGMRKGWL